MSKFDNVPIEKDAEFYFSAESTFGDYDVLYQNWRWDGIEAESLIFVAEDIESLYANRSGHILLLRSKLRAFF